MKKYLLLSLLAFVCACAPKEQDFIEPAGHKASIQADSFVSVDGVSLPMRAWVPSRPAKVVVLALHGFNDYSRAFEGLGAYMKKQGAAVYAYDQRGFGGAPEPGIWAGQENLVRDAAQAVMALRAKHPKAKLYLLGESMGGAVSIAALTQPDFPKVDGLILSAPAVWGSGGMNPLFRGTLWLMAHAVPYKRFTGSDLKVLASSNFDMLRQMASDPLVIKETRVDAVYGVVGMMGSAYDRVPQLNMPTLLLYGAQDQVIPPWPITETLERFGGPVTYAYYPHGFHMLLRDLQGERVMGDIWSWIRDPKKALPSGFGVEHPAGKPVELPRIRVKSRDIWPEAAKN